MRRRLLVLVGAITLLVPSAALANGPTVADRLERTPARAQIDPSFVPASQDDARVVTVMLQMAGDPVAVVQSRSARALTAGQKAQIKRQLKAQQDAIKGAVQARGGTIRSQLMSAYNGMKVQIARGRVAELATLPNVIAVRAVQLFEPDNVDSVPWIGAPGVWDDLGLTGDGIKIAVIDTGIDYTHANFDGPGTVEAFETADATDTDIDATDLTMIGPDAPKVKGGHDFVGDDYDGSDPDLDTPAPDPNPLDCNGHGSHVAGTATGLGVTAEGDTYTGPYDSTTYDTDFTVGPGVAPEADLYGLRVFGCLGSTDVVDEAIDWAVDNGMDVINMSLGSTFGRDSDPSVEASNNAALAGVAVVTSAGNSGSQQYIGGSPGTAKRALNTAAQDTIASSPGVSLALSTGPTIVALNANDAVVVDGTNLDIVVLRNEDDSVSLGCDPQEYIDADVEGKLVVTVRGDCARVARAIFGEQAGAAAVAMINTDSGYPPFEGPITSNPDTGEPFEVTIPFLGVRGVLGAGSDGDTLEAADGGDATLSNTAIANPNFERFASFSSGGPRRGDSHLKPDITAPGVSIESTLVGSGNAATRISGTSMASPHVAGVAALTIQAHPTWTVEEIKAAIVNTGDPSAIPGPTGPNPFRISRGGTGLVQPWSSTNTEVVAIGGEPGTANLSFGFSELPTTNFSALKTITLKNHGATPATFAVGTAFAAGSPHSVVLGSSSVTVAAGGTQTLNVTLNVPTATVGTAGAFREVAGLVTFTPQGGANNDVTLRVPYYLVPRGASATRTELAQAVSPVHRNLNAIVHNVGLAPGDADFFQWGLSDANDGLEQNDVRAIGLQTVPGPDAGLPASDKLLLFAVNNWTRWDNMAVDEYDILVDVDEDGTPDFAVVAADIGVLTTGLFNGQMGVAVFDLDLGGGVLGPFLASYRFTNGTALFPVIASDLGLSEANPDFTYWAAAFALRDATTGDDQVSGTARYNAWRPAIDGYNSYVLAPPGHLIPTSIPVSRSDYLRQRPLGVMVVYADNVAGAKEAQLIAQGKKK